jgi:coenzyme F420-reducing hydrogenase delta subunit
VNPEIIVALLSLFGTLCGSLAGVLVSNKLTNYRLEQLEHVVEELRGVKERVTVVEQSAKSAHKRIDAFSNK